MLKLLRKKGTIKILLWALALALIVTLGIFGAPIDSGPAGQSDVAGKINGKSIPLKDFQKQYANTRDRALLQHGDNFFKISQYLNLEGDTWDRIIMLKEASKQKIKVTDEEVVEFLQDLKMFHRDGKFDNILYEDILRYVFKRKVRDFEEGMRDNLMINKLVDVHTEGIFIPEEKVKDEYAKRNVRVQVNYFAFKADQFLNKAKLEENEAQEYFDQNAPQFFLPETVNVTYLTFPFPEEATTEDKDAVHKKALNAYIELNENKDFETVAKENEIKVQTSGVFSREKPNFNIGWSYEVLQTVFDMKLNEISQPIDTDKGVQILKLSEKNEGRIPEFKEVQEDVNKVVLNNKAAEIAKTTAQEHLTKIQSANDKSAEGIKKLANSLKLEMKQTPFFSRDEYLPEIGVAKDFQSAAFELSEENSISDLVETKDAVYILHYAGKEPFDEEKYTKAKEEFRQTLEDEKKNELTIEYLTNLRNNAELENFLVNASEDSEAPEPQVININ